MANVDKAFGLRPYKGAGWPVQQAAKYLINPSGYGTSIYQGDMTIFAGGYINTAGALSGVNGCAVRVLFRLYMTEHSIASRTAAQTAMLCPS